MIDEHFICRKQFTGKKDHQKQGQPGYKRRGPEDGFLFVSL